MRADDASTAGDRAPRRTCRRAARMAVAVIAWLPLPAFAAEPVLTINGQRRFLTGWYTHSPQSGQGNAYVEEPAANGFDFIMPYDIWTQPGGSSDVIAVLNLAQARGIRVLVHGVWSPDPWILEQRVNLIRNHPAMAGYFLYDEPELDGTTPQQLLARYHAIRALDANPEHPVVTVFTSYIIQGKGDRITRYLPATDVQALDCYMVHQDEAELQPDLAMIAVETKLGVARGQAAGKAGFIIVPPAMQGGAGRGYRMPTYREMRYLVYAPITLGAGGVWPWVFGRWGDFESTAAQREAAVNPNIRELRTLVPLLTAPSAGLSVRSVAGDVPLANAYGATYGLNRVTCTLRGGATDAVLVAANNSTSTRAGVDFRMEGLHPSIRTASVLGEQRSVSITGGLLVDDFAGPYSVHVYRLMPPRADGAKDLLICRPSNGQFFSGLTEASTGYAIGFGRGSSVLFGGADFTPLAGDVNADGLDDLILYNRTSGRWLCGLTGPDGSLGSGGSEALGPLSPGDVPRVGDLDGDGCTDLLIYRPSTGQWFSGITSAAGALTWTGSSVQFGTPDYTPLVADVNGDGRSDLLIYNRANGRWLSGLTGPGGALGNAGTEVYGPFLAGDVPLAGDLNGDRRADLLIYRPSNGQWISGLTTAGGALTAGGMVLQFGTADYHPLAGDINADGRSDLVLYHRGTGRWLSGITGPGGALSGTGTEVYGPYLSGDVPLLADTGGRPGPRPGCALPGADADQDGDVDQEDFGDFQKCMSGSGGGLLLPGCVCFDTHPAAGDGDVDSDDFDMFLLCASGPGVPAEPDCGDPW